MINVFGLVLEISKMCKKVLFFENNMKTAYVYTYHLSFYICDKNLYFIQTLILKSNL